jgi:cell wall-associated NlpC family hydrolase
MQRLVGNAAVVQLLGDEQTPDAGGGGQVPLRDKIIKAAQRWEGKPYGFGMGHGDIVPEEQLDPNAQVSIGIDCSGLVHQVFGDCGVSIGGTAEQIYGGGKEVAEADARPGDLVFWWGESAARKESGIEHVGIFAGQGEVIHAPHTGDVVKQGKIWSKNFAGYRDVLPKG